MKELEMYESKEKFACKHRDECGCCELSAYMGLCMSPELCAHITEESEV